MTRFERAGWLMAASIVVVVGAVVATVMLQPLVVTLAGVWPW